MCVLSLLFSSVSSAFSSLPPLLSPQLLPLLFSSFLFFCLCRSPLSLLPLILLFLCFLIHLFRLFCLLCFLFFLLPLSFLPFLPPLFPSFSAAPFVSSASLAFCPFCSLPIFRLLAFSAPFTSFSSVQKPGQFSLLLVFIPADVSTFYLFCPKARSILGCLSQPPD